MPKRTNKASDIPLVAPTLPKTLVVGAEEVADIKMPPMPEMPAEAPEKASKSKQPQTSKEAKAKATSEAVENAWVFLKLGEKPVQNDDEMVTRIDRFFTTCRNTSQLPSFEKLCLILGYTKNEVTSWENGTAHGFSSRTGSIIRQAKLALAAIDADLAMGGQVQASVYQFRSKNFSGMKDQTETVYTPNMEPAVKSLAELIEGSKMLPEYTTITAEYTEKKPRKKKTEKTEN